MSDNDLIRRGDALDAANEADPLELLTQGASKIMDRIAALPAVTLLTTFEEKMAQLPQERQDRIIANAAKLAALDEIARLGQEFDAAPATHLHANKDGVLDNDLYDLLAPPDPACDHCGMDPAAIREAAIMKCANAIWHGPIRDYGRAAQGHELTAAHKCRDTILALIPTKLEPPNDQTNP